MTGSSVTDVCLSASTACISFLCLLCMVTDLPSGEWGRGQMHMRDMKGQTNRKREESDRETRCVLSHAVICLLVVFRLTTPLIHSHHTHILFPRRPRGQWHRASLRVCLFTSNYRNRTISAAAATIFYILV